MALKSSKKERERERERETERERERQREREKEKERKRKKEGKKERKNDRLMFKGEWRHIALKFWDLLIRCSKAHQENLVLRDLLEKVETVGTNS